MCFESMFSKVLNGLSWVGLQVSKISVQTLDLELCKHSYKPDSKRTSDTSYEPGKPYELNPKHMLAVTCKPYKPWILNSKPH